MTVSEFKPIKAFVENRYLYDMQNVEGYSVCEIMGISAYLHQPLTFHILIDKKYIYSNIPIVALSLIAIQPITNKIPNDVLSHVNCPDISIEMVQFNSLKDKKASCYLRKIDKWYKIDNYYFAIDFYEDNEFLHFVALENGQFALIPNHKINLGGETKLEPYKKSRQDWSIK
jgi:hypothetical protein